MTATAEPSAAVPPPRPPRPGTVTVAFWLQLATVLILLGLVTLLVLAAVDWNDAIDKALRQVPDADPDEVRAERWNTAMMATVFGVPALLLALWLGLTSGWVLRGSNTARVMVFVAGGLQLLLCVVQGCAGAFLIPFGLAFALTDGPYVDETYPEEVPPPDDEFWQESNFIEALYDQPNAFEVFLPLTGLGVLLVFLLTAAVVLLLALPPAHRWFVPRTDPATAWPLPGRDIPNVYLVGYPVPMSHPGYPAPSGHPPQAGYPPAYPSPPWYGAPDAGYAVPGYTVPGPDPAGHLPPQAAPPTGPETPPTPADPPLSDGPTAPGGGEHGGAGSGGVDQADR
ncbi:hypothetical protein O3597_24290 [Verrucosispora sp. WMMA2044]|uniref:hypothetical protein n=1 Tax=Verrucosispora sp. WMMA2044 TaxID=3016419 RepID=UPI00248B8343|nr:hypothetical protein [Verrucosispora sp. WMMA2044]WBB48192.1 hypothetical protein O3597_24290 [Verrucosispora sp. WMMA2044]